MPVWPICFCSCWPRPPPPIRLPAASTCISFIDTPPSASAPRAASAARSTVSLSGCLPNLVIEMPRIHTSSDTGRLQWLEAEADGLGAFTVGRDREDRQPHLHPQPDVLRIRLHVHEVRPHARASAV